MKKKKTTKKPSSHTLMRAIKISIAEEMLLAPRILHYTEGNFSRYARTALINYVPKKGDFKC